MSFRISTDLLEKLAAQVELTGESKTSVVIRALTHALDCPYYEASIADCRLNTDSADPEALLAQITSHLQHWLHQLRHKQQANALDETQQRQFILLKQTLTALLALEQTAVPQFYQHPLMAVLSTLDASEALGNASESHMAKTFGQILATASDLIFVLDRNGRFTYLNPAGSWVFGLEPGQILGKTWQELGFRDGNSDAFMNQCEHATQTGHLVNGEFHVVVSGQSRSYEYILSPLRASGVQVSALVCIARDVTQRQRTEIALRESEQKYRNLFESAHDSILIVDVETHQVLDANWSACKLLGYTRREILQLEIGALEAPMDVISREALWRSLDVDGCVIYEHVYRRKDQTELPVEVSSRVIEYEHRLAIQSFVRDIADRKHAEAEIQALNAELGHRVLTQTTALRRTNEELMHEISNRQQIEGALRLSEQRYHALAEHSPVGIFRTDLRGRCIDLNQRCEHMIGYTREEALKAPWEPKLHPDDRGHVVQAWADAIAHQTSYKVECRLIQANDSYRWVVAEAQPEWGQDGILKGYVHTITDITPFKECDGRSASSSARRSDRPDSGTPADAADGIAPEPLKPDQEGRSQQSNTDIIAPQPPEAPHAQDLHNPVEQSYRRLFENAPVGLFQRLPMGRYLRVNLALAMICGYDSPSELLDAITPTDHHSYVNPNRWADLMQQLQAQSSVKQVESQIYRKDGSIIWVSEDICTVRNSHGRLLYLEGVVIDISHRKRAEDEWQKRQAQHASNYAWQTQLINQLPIGLCAYHTLPHEPYVQFISWNSHLTMMTGYTLDTMNQTGWYVLLQDSPEVLQHLIEQDYLHQGDRPIYEEAWKITTASGTSQTVWVSICNINIEPDVRQTVMLLQEIEPDAVNNYAHRLINSVIDKPGMKSYRPDVSQSGVQPLASSVLNFVAKHLAATTYREIFHTDGTNTLLNISYPDTDQSDFNCTDLTWKKDANRFLNRIHPDDRSQFEACLMRSHTDLTPLNCRYRIITASGNFAWVQEYAQFSRLKNGDIVADGIILASGQFQERYQSRCSTKH